MGSRESAALLLHCLSFSQSSEPVDLGELTESEWFGLLRQALRHGVAPLLFSRLSLGSGSKVPSEVSKKLEQAFYSNAYRNLHLLAEASRVLETLRAKNIPVIALKGAHLASCVYDSVAHRSMSDIDILVREGDLSQTQEILLSSGYGPTERPSIESRTERQHHLMPFIKSGAVHVEIEVHWALGGRDGPFKIFRIDMEGLWTRARPAVISGAEALVLAPEDLLLYLCVHGTYKHQLTYGIRGLYDVLETIRRHQGALDWEVLQRRAALWQVERCVFLTLSLAREKLGAPVPARVLQALEPEIPCKIIEDTTDLLLFGERISPEYAEVWNPARSPNKMGLLLKSVFPSRRTMKRTYPAAASSRFFYFYYLLRWLDLLRRYGRVTWQIVRGSEAIKARVRAENNRKALRRWLSSG